MTFGEGEAFSTPLEGSFESKAIDLSQGAFVGGHISRQQLEGESEDIDIDEDAEDTPPVAEGPDASNDDPWGLDGTGALPPLPEDQEANLPPAPVVEEEDEMQLPPAPVVEEDDAAHESPLAAASSSSAPSDEVAEEGQDTAVGMPAFSPGGGDGADAPVDSEHGQDTAIGIPAFSADAGEMGGSDVQGGQNAADTQPAVPAHLELPSMDFSVPSFDTGDLGGVSPEHTGVPAEGTTAGGSAELPAHLQLPTFPDFALPPVPGEEDAEQSQSSEAPTPTAAPGETTEQQEAVPAHLAAPTAATPPPLAPPPLAKKRPKPAPQQAPANDNPLGDLPAFGLPDLGQVAAKKEVTLLGADAAAEITADAGKRSVVPYLLGLIFLGAGVGVWFKQDDIIAMLKPETDIVTETPEDKARMALKEGKEAYAAAESALKDGKESNGETKLQEAVNHFMAALGHMPKFGEAHRNLGIAYAKLKKQDDAVEHYRKYLALSPDADDAAEVREIIAAYEKAQGKKPAEAKQEPPPSDSKAKSAKRRRR